MSGETFLAKLFAIGVLWWFYETAKEKGEPAINWAITGLIGYVIAWGLMRYSLVAGLLNVVEKTMMTGFLVMQIPTIFAIVAVFFIRKKLIANAAEKDN